MMALLSAEPAVAKPYDLSLWRNLTLQGDAPPTFLQEGALQVVYAGDSDHQNMIFMVTDGSDLYVLSVDAQ